MHDTLELAGAYADLWIDTCKGTIAPPEVLPQGWTYQTNEPVPEQYFWLWHPDEFTNRSLTSQANSSLEDRIFNSPSSIFKSSIPTHLQNKYGEMKSIPAIEIYKLPGMVRHGLQWHFNFKK